MRVGSIHNAVGLDTRVVDHRGRYSIRPDATKTKAAWRAFAEGEELPVGAVREHVRQSWLRCRRHGVNPYAMETQRLSEQDTAKLRAGSRELIEAATPYMRALSIAAGSDHHAAMLSDETGRVLEIVADEETAFRTEGFPTPGALLAESVAGANGIGTPLAEDAYVEIVGPEHFIEGFQVYTCQGLPLKSMDGNTVGALSMSVRRIEAAERVHEILVCAAHGIEAEILHRRLGRELAEVLKHAGKASPAIDALRQDVTQLQTAARLRLEHAALVTRDQLDGALDFVSLANQLIRRFRGQSVLWRDIAILDESPPRTVDLQLRIVEIAELMATEAAIHGVRMKIPNGSPVYVTADSREVSRALFRCLLKSFDTLKGGGEVEARVVCLQSRGVARALFSAPHGLSLEFPLAASEGQPQTEDDPVIAETPTHQPAPRNSPS